MRAVNVLTVANLPEVILEVLPGRAPCQIAHVDSLGDTNDTACRHQRQSSGGSLVLS